ncbi:ATP-binding protein [Glycomyces sp. L485]|nr:ATP-binding protein [Glycomyces sp. L485]
MPAATPAPERLRVPHQAGAPTIVRRWLRESLPHLPDDVRDDLLVCATELVSNAVRHARPLPAGDLCVTCIVGPRDVEVRVVDGGSVTQPHVCSINLDSAHGRGMFIVSKLSAVWGAKSLDDGTQEVWARIPVRLGACRSVRSSSTWSSTAPPHCSPAPPRCGRR